MERAIEAWLNDAPIHNCPDALKLFMLCEGMNWAHLPAPGAIYNQDPRLLDEWFKIFQARAFHDKQKREREKRPRQKSYL